MFYIQLIFFNFVITAITASFICKCFMNLIIKKTCTYLNEAEKHIFDKIDEHNVK